MAGERKDHDQSADAPLRVDDFGDARRTLETLLRNLPGIVYRCKNEPDWPTDYVGGRCAEMTGYSAEDFLAGRPEFGDIIHEDDRQFVWQHVQACLANDQPFQLQYRVRTAGGAISWVFEQGTRVPHGDDIRLEGFIWDANASKRHEEELAHTQRMEVVGRLAGGVAHDFNNILTVITSYADMLAKRLPDDRSEQADAGEIRAAAQRGSELTRQLLSFARRQELEPQIFEVDAAVEQIERMLRRLLEEDVELDVHLAAPGAYVRMDRGQLEVALTNLAVNARDAMPEGGRLSIRSDAREQDTSEGEMAPGQYVAITVEDTGVGMDAATRERIFEPFFTTKPPGRGTGLGLATVQRILRSISGDVRMRSTPGQGTSFELLIPRTEARATPTEIAEPEAPAPQGHETLLLVEDSPIVRKVCARVLRSLGYAVLEAGVPKRARDLAATTPIDLLITDVVLPQTPGPRLAAELRDQYPGLRVLYMSGYPEDIHSQKARAEVGDSFLLKPFDPDVLARAVRRALESPHEKAT